MTRLAYVDASAIVKLVLHEPDTNSMVRWFVEVERVATSVLGVIETRRAVARRSHDAVHLRSVLATLVTLALDDVIARSASAIQPPLLRTLDAVHLATALSLGAELDAFVTYDDRLAAAARGLGLPVVRPA
ncbi:MAG TPA: type II toxin-antitoxin system VapC family toxin [Candidatus Limnocylindrales bacterium]|nr:type II toxin-antitoxin system VapC family toxin [Candidatus Limnocylindrales bacterium]